MGEVMVAITGTLFDTMAYSHHFYPLKLTWLLFFMLSFCWFNLFYSLSIADLLVTKLGSILINLSGPMDILIHT